MEKRILVIGSINMDLIIETPKIPAGGESVLAKSYRTSPGGKGANQALALRKIGAEPVYIGKVGADGYGEALKASLTEHGLATDKLITGEGLSTGLAVIMLESNGENRILVLNGANDHLNTQDIRSHLYIPGQYACILLQLEIPLETVEFIIKQGKKLGIPVIVDAGPSQKCDIKIFDGVDIISPNQTELATLTCLPADNIEDAKLACTELKQKTNAGMVVLKMGGLGSLVLNDGGYQFFPAFKVDVKDTTAAGDGFTAALTQGFVNGWPLDRIITYANAVGALTVTKLGAYDALPNKTEIEQFLQEQGVA